MTIFDRKVVIFVQIISTLFTSIVDAGFHSLLLTFKVQTKMMSYFDGFWIKLS